MASFILNALSRPGAVLPFGTSRGGQQMRRASRPSGPPATPPSEELGRDPHILAEALDGTLSAVLAARDRGLIQDGTVLRSLTHLDALDVPAAADELLGGLEDTMQMCRTEYATGAIPNLGAYVPAVATFLRSVVKDQDVIPRTARGGRELVDDVYERAGRLLRAFGGTTDDAEEEVEEEETPQPPQRRRLRQAPVSKPRQAPQEPEPPPASVDVGAFATAPKTCGAWKLRRVPAGPPQSPDELIDTDGAVTRLG